ncbi:iron ABC transporter permease [Phenylobacterium sp.]|uniref:FecCD family ABC transporter permease n=1 Tax=Phenylobacterium sp. TaxID=1871053 RepID=UPI00272FE995|nr:iron ABC transporter permease [Phenylobacterium sp.]MDP1600764.1 iron ABC transporter permease [Phenylobacterium sp.]MDP3594672.1 iron ABC transporter permease [Phenylobacterium sp.]
MTRRQTTILALIVLTILLSMVSMAAGRVWTPFSAWTDHSDPRWAIIFELRLPRTILAIGVGAALGMAGAAMQGYTRNPLADPGALGVSSMAALGAVLTLYLGAGAAEPWVIATAAMIGALIAVMLLLALSGQASSIVTFILAGVILQTMAGAGVALALSLAPNPWAVNEIINWLMGSLADRSIGEVQMALPLIAAGCVMLVFIGRGLDALTLGETGARSLGVNMTATRWILAIGVALTAGASVAVTGVIGFVGLIVPHLLRPLVGARPGGLLIPSAIGGAVLVLAADIAVRLTPAASEVKLGVAMAVLGGPFFFVLLLSLRRRIA